jgi:hypothetical protein
MAERSFRQWLQMFEIRPVLLFANVSIGASGAPTLNANARGIASVAATGAGAYTITLQDKYTKLLDISSSFITSTGTDAALEDDDHRRRCGQLASYRHDVVFRVAAGTATDPSNGAVLLLKIMLRNSSAPI